MKLNIFLCLMALLILNSCSTSKNSIAKSQEDKTLISAIKKLDKKSNNEELQSSLTQLYSEAARVHLDNIEIYNTLQDAEKWDKMYREYQSLQHLTDIINKSAVARRLINPTSYQSQIEALKINAASDYYQLGEEFMAIGDRKAYRDAYATFRKVQEYVPGFKDSNQQLAQAYQNSVVNVVVNPVTDNSLYYNNIGMNRYGNSFNNDYLQRNLVNDLGGNNSKNASARYYTDWDARRLNVNPDMIVDLTWVNLDIPRPYTSNYSRNVSRQIQVGRDTSGNVLYKTVSGTLYITKRYFTASGDLETSIMETGTRNLVDSRRYNAQFNWEQETATYRGDRRALSGYELSILQNSSYRVPSKDQILNELYQRIYPQVKNGIYNAVRW
ncbi:hypothetical protein BH20BAC1_BH20BAC1_12150 [soil metagenome]